MRVRGVIEGFYGRPWTHADRLDLIAFCGRHALNAWVHAPKGDPYHRERWREPYPDAELEQLAGLVREASRHEIEFTYAIAPGLSICYSRGEDFDELIAKCEQIASVGVRSFQLLWDDLEHGLRCAEDHERYGGTERPSGAAQADLSNRFRAAFQQDGPLVVCPMGYAGTGDSPYRRTFSSLLDPEIVVYWTGPEVVSSAITREDLETTITRFHGHAVLIWDNYPVNDFAVDRLFLAPLRGRDPRLGAGGALGLIANAMVQAVPSKLALATVADWTRDPAGYDPIDSYERALRAHGAEVVEALRVVAHGSAQVAEPPDIASLIEALACGVDAATGVALLQPFV